MKRGSILYIVSRFPKITETFVLNEWLVLRRRFNMRLGSLLRSRGGQVHPAAARVVSEVWFAPLFDLSTLHAQLFWLRRRPRTYLATLLAVLRGSRPAGGGVVKGGVVFIQAAWLARQVRDHGMSHVHAHFANHPATAAWVVYRLTGVPFSFTAHANDLFVGPALLDRKVDEAAFVATISEYNRSYIQTRLPSARRIELIRCGVDPSRFRGSTDEGHRRRLICVASLVPKKGHLYLMRAFSMLSSEFPDVELTLVGDGSERDRIRHLAERLGVEPRVHMLGDMQMDQVQTALARSHIFVLASVRLPSGRAEGIPVSLMEAMATGLPVVATNISGIPELVIDEVTGLLVPERESDALARAIRRLIVDDRLVHRLVTGARAHVAGHFNLEVESNRLGDLFEEQLPGRPDG